MSDRPPRRCTRSHTDETQLDVGRTLAHRVRRLVPGGGAEAEPMGPRRAGAFVIDGEQIDVAADHIVVVPANTPPALSALGGHHCAC